MKRAVLFAALLLIGLAPRLEAEAMDCLPSLRCKDRPKCEFFYELKLAKARLGAMKSASLGDVEATDEQELNRYNESVDNDMRKAYRKYAKCPPRNYDYAKPDRFGILRLYNCEVANTEAVLRGEVKPQSLKEALGVSNSCSELVEGEYAGAQARERLCLAVDAKQRRSGPYPISDVKASDLAHAQAKVDSLEASLLKYWRACSAEADAKTARQVAKAGLEALKKKPAKRQTKKTPKRASGPRTR